MDANSMYNNNFNFIRLLASFLVFYGHAYILLGMSINSVLDHVLAVHIFFIISGYLIAMSWEKEPSLRRFFIKRSLRIFPAFIIIILLSAFILGPIITSWNLYDYFTSLTLLIYIKNVLLHISYSLPGVFETNIYPLAVNGSIWTLPIEFLMYLLVPVFVGNRYKKYTALGLFSLFFWLTFTKELPFNTIIIYGSDLKQIAINGMYFWSGAIIYVWNIKNKFSFESFVIALLALLFLSQWREIYASCSVFLISFIVLSFGASASKILNIFNKVDYSYGIYIYAFPVQQTIIHYFPKISILNFLVFGFVVTLLLGALSWHLIEKPILKLKSLKRLNYDCQ